MMSFKNLKEFMKAGKEALILMKKKSMLSFVMAPLMALFVTLLVAPFGVHMLMPSNALASECQIDRAPTDNCLLGTWALDHSSVANFFRNLPATRGMTFLGSSGKFEVKFTSEHDGQKVIWTLENWKFESVMQAGTPREVHMTQVSQGKMVSKYSNGSGVICAKGLSSTAQTTVTMRVGGRTLTQPGTFPFDSMTRNFTYSCRGDDLIYHKALNVGPGGEDMEFNYHFKRISRE